MKLKIRNILNKGIYTYIVVFLIFGISFYFILTKNTKAEQMGSSPDTWGAQSVIMRSYNALVSKGTNYGSSSSPDWTANQGTYWNRIIYSATWEPDGTATEQDVLSGKTFYSGLNNRTIRTGTFSNPTIDYSLQQFVDYDDAHASDYTGEESTWINTNSSSGNQVWYDTRTGLYWARSQPTTLTNSFSSPSTGVCDFFNTGTYPTRGSYGTSGTDPACGNAINACAVLSLASTEGQLAKTDWYLPSQKELKEAYANGIYNKAGATFTTTSNFWSSTEIPAIAPTPGSRVCVTATPTTPVRLTATRSGVCVEIRIYRTESRTQSGISYFP